MLPCFVFLLRHKIIDNVKCQNKVCTRLPLEHQLPPSPAVLYLLLNFSWHHSIPPWMTPSHFFTQLLWIFQPPCLSLLSLLCGVSEGSLILNLSWPSSNWVQWTLRLLFLTVPDLVYCSFQIMALVLIARSQLAIISTQYQQKIATC